MRIIPANTDLPLLLAQPGVFARRYSLPLLVLLIGATADVITTFINLRQFGLSVEVHPAQRIVSQAVGVTLGVPLAKMIQLAFGVAVASWWRPWCPWLLIAGGILYALAAVSNYWLLL